MKKQLLPPQLASGLHIEIVFEDFRTTLIGQNQGASITGYEVQNIQFMLDSTEMTDDVQKTINMESADNGIEYAYERIYTNISQQPSEQTTVSVQIRKAVSQACFATSIVIDSAGAVDITKDPLAAVQNDTKNWQYRLGSLYFPNQRIEDPDIDGTESYIIAQQTYDKLQNPYCESGVSLYNFNLSLGIMASSFEKNTSLNMSGLPINNSRVLELQAEFDTFTGSREIVTFLQYCSVARTFIDNVAVAI